MEIKPQIKGLEIRTAAEMAKEAEENRKYWDESFKISDGWLTIKTPASPYGDYDIELTRIDSQVKLLGWIRHLGEKNWVTSDLIIELIDRVSLHFGWNPHPNI